MRVRFALTEEQEAKCSARDQGKRLRRTRNRLYRKRQELRVSVKQMQLALSQLEHESAFAPLLALGGQVLRFSFAHLVFLASVVIWGV